MTYTRRLPSRTTVTAHGVRRRGLHGLGDFSDNDQCSTIPMGDPYRRPGNYCATPDGGIVTFNSDGSVVRTPGGVDPDPAHPAGTTNANSGGASSGSVFDSVGRLLGGLFGQSPQPPVTAPAQGGISTTTAVALAGGAILLAVMLSRR